MPVRGCRKGGDVCPVTAEVRGSFFDGADDGVEGVVLVPLSAFRCHTKS